MAQRDIVRDKEKRIVEFKTSVRGISKDYIQAMLNHLSLNPHEFKSLIFKPHPNNLMAHCVFLHTHNELGDNYTNIGYAEHLQDGDEVDYRLSGGYHHLLARQNLVLDRLGNEITLARLGTEKSLPSGYQIYQENSIVHQYYDRAKIPAGYMVLLQLNKVFNKPCHYGMELLVKRSYQEGVEKKPLLNAFRSFTKDRSASRDDERKAA